MIAALIDANPSWTFSVLQENANKLKTWINILAQGEPDKVEVVVDLSVKADQKPKKVSLKELSDFLDEQMIKPIDQKLHTINTATTSNPTNEEKQHFVAKSTAALDSANGVTLLPTTKPADTSNPTQKAVEALDLWKLQKRIYAMFESICEQLDFVEPEKLAQLHLAFSRRTEKDFTLFKPLTLKTKNDSDRTLILPQPQSAIALGSAYSVIGPHR